MLKYSKKFLKLGKKSKLYLQILDNVEKNVKKLFLCAFQRNFGYLFLLHCVYLGISKSRKKFRIISKKISENFENYFGKFRKVFRKIFKIKSFRKISKIISKNFEKFQIFLEISRNINEIFENYFENFFF